MFFRRTYSLLCLFLFVTPSACSKAEPTDNECDPPAESDCEKYYNRLNLLNVPDVQQTTAYSCGASALQAVLYYWGIVRTERTLMTELGTTPDLGTHPSNIVSVASDNYNLYADRRNDLTIADLEEGISEGFTIIVDIQAWRDGTGSWDDTWEDGHYLVFIGYDDENLYFEDPVLFGTRASIPRAEFESRWHDYEGETYATATEINYHLGIFIFGSEHSPIFEHVE